MYPWGWREHTPFLAGHGKCAVVCWPCVTLQYVHCEQPETLAEEQYFTFWSKCRLIFQSVWVFTKLAGTWSKGEYFLAQVIKCVLEESCTFPSNRLLGFLWHAFFFFFFSQDLLLEAVAAGNFISQIQQGKGKLNQGLKLRKASNLYL